MKLLSIPVGLLLATGSPSNAQVVDGFDFPVCYPDGAGCSPAARGFKVVTLDDGSVRFHVAEDWNRGVENDDWRDPVYAIANGEVAFAGNAGRKWGNVVILEHRIIPTLPSLPNGLRVRSLYGHLDRIDRSSGTVTRGEQIGTVGRGYRYEKDGLVSYDYLAHLHLEIRTDTSIGVVNPYRELGDTDGWIEPSNFIRCRRKLGSRVVRGTVDFDRFPNSVPIPEGEILTGQFASLGVSSLGGLLAEDASQNAGDFFFGMSVPNVASPGGISPGPAGSYSCIGNPRVEFSQGMRQVSIQAFVSQPNPFGFTQTLRLIGRDSAGGTISTTECSSGSPIDSFTLSLRSSSATIRSIQVEGIGAGTSGLCAAFDNLAFSP